MSLLSIPAVKQVSFPSTYEYIQGSIDRQTIQISNYPTIKTSKLPIIQPFNHAVQLPNHPNGQ